MTNAKYSVLFMRDDSDVKRYRIRPFWLKSFLFFVLFLMAATAASVYVGYVSWKANRQLNTDNKVLEQRLVEAEVRLERLGNMEKILESHDPAELQTLLSAAPVEQPAPPPPPQAPPVDLRKIFGRTDAKLATVDNMQVGISGRSVTASFDLNNLQASNALSGYADFALVMNDGTELPVKTNRTDLSFQIQRFKRVRTVFSLPTDADAKEIFAVRVVIKGTDGDVIFSETYPLYNILAS